MVFVIDNQNNYPTNLPVHGSDTRSKNQSYLPIVNPSCWQWGVSYCAVKIFNTLPKDIKNLRNNKLKLKIELHKYLIARSFYLPTGFFENNASNVHNSCFNLLPFSYID
jgi:hypothetical protein